MNEEKHPVEQIAELVGGTITSGGVLPDGSGFATVSYPLPKTHWLYNQDGSEYCGPCPMVFRTGTKEQRFGMSRNEFAEKIQVAAKYAIRASTLCGKDDDFDPDAMVQNMVCGMLGFWTADGFSSDAWENPPEES